LSGSSWIFYLVVLVQVILFLLLFKRPVWAVASLIVGQLTVSSFKFSIVGIPMSLRLFWAILAILLLLPLLLYQGRRLEFGGRVRYVLIPALLFFALATISNLTNTDLYTSVRYLREPVTALAILMLVPAAVRDESDLKTLSIVAVVTCVASAAVALLQHYTSTSAFSLYFSGAAENVRVTGLTGGAYAIGYMFPAVLLPMVAVLFLKGARPGPRVLLLVCAAVIAAGLYFSYTRSGVYFLAAGLLVVGFYMTGKAKRQLLLLCFIGFAIFFVSVSLAGNRYVQGFSKEGSAAGRLVLWQAALNIASDHPILGIGVGQFEQVSQNYASTVSLSSKETLGAESVLGVYQAHNDYLTIWSSFGVLALLVYLWLMLGIFINFLIAYRRSRTRFLRAFTLGSIGAMVALALYSAVQNLLDSSMLMWVFGGLSIAAARMASPRLVSGENVQHEAAAVQSNLLPET
jgi:O-antigen ligase